MAAPECFSMLLQKLISLLTGTPSPSNLEIASRLVGKPEMTRHVDLTPEEAGLTLYNHDNLLYERLTNFGDDSLRTKSKRGSMDIARAQKQPSSERSSHSSTPPTADDWAAFRPVIINLYIEQQKTLKEVNSIMRSRYGFKASPRMYKPRLDEWGVHKYYSTKQNLCIAAVLRDYENSNKTLPIIMVNGATMEMNRVRRFWQNQNDDKPLQAKMIMLIDKYAKRDGSTSSVLEPESIDIDKLLLMHCSKSTMPMTCPSNSPSSVPRQLISDGNGSVQAVLVYTMDYSKWCLQPSSDPAHQQSHPQSFAGGMVSISFSGKARLISQMLCNKFHDGLGLLESGDINAAFAEFETGCQLVSSFLLMRPILFFRSLFMVLGTRRWERFDEVQQRLLAFIASMAKNKLGDQHPSFLALQELRKGDTMKASAELVLRSLLDTLEGQLGPVHSEVLKLKRSISIVLRRQEDFPLAKSILCSAVKVTEELRGPLHEETRRTLRRLGRLFIDQGKLDEAEEIYMDVLDRGHAAQGVASPDENTLYAYQSLAVIERLRSNNERCKAWLLKEMAAAASIAQTQICTSGAQVVEGNVRLIPRFRQGELTMSMANTYHAPLFSWTLESLH